MTTEIPSVEFEFLEALGTLTVTVSDGEHRISVRLNENATDSVFKMFNPIRSLEQLAHSWRSADVNMAALTRRRPAGIFEEAKELEFERALKLGKEVQKFIEENPVLIALIAWAQQPSLSSERFLRVAIDELVKSDPGRVKSEGNGG